MNQNVRNLRKLLPVELAELAVKETKFSVKPRFFRKRRCGCRIDDHTELVDVISFCPLHAHAPELRAILTRLIREIEQQGRQADFGDAYGQAFALLVKLDPVVKGKTCGNCRKFWPRMPDGNFGKCRSRKVRGAMSLRWRNTPASVADMDDSGNLTSIPCRHWKRAK